MPAQYALIPQEELVYLDGGAITQEQVIQFGVNVLVNGLMFLGGSFFAAGVTMVFNAYDGVTITSGNKVMGDFFSSLDGGQWIFLGVATMLAGVYAAVQASSYYNGLIKPIIDAVQQAYDQTMAEQAAALPAAA